MSSYFSDEILNRIPIVGSINQAMGIFAIVAGILFVIGFFMLIYGKVWPAVICLVLSVLLGGPQLLKRQYLRF